MGAGPAALGAPSCGIRQPIARDAGMKREGWRSMHWRGDRADWGRLLGHFCPTRMDTKCAQGCRQGRGWRWQQTGLARPCPSASALFSAGGYDPSEGCWQLGSQTCPQNLSSLSNPLGLLGAIPPGTKAGCDAWVIGLIAAVSFGSAQRGCEAARGDLGSLRAAAPSQNHAGLLPPVPSPGQAAFLLFLFFLLFSSCQ